MYVFAGESPEPVGKLSAVLMIGLVAAGVSGCGSSSSGAANATPATSSLSQLAQLGEKIFHDTSLSANGLQSCASCHDAQHAFAQPNNDAVPTGGLGMDRSGVRNAPSLRYLLENPAFFFDSEGTPTGGFNRDGRSKNLAEQSIRPFLNPAEMANASSAEVVDRLSQATYAADFRKLFGDQIFADSEQAFFDAREALQAYEREVTEFAPFSSKYDGFLSGKITLTDQELRGLALYSDPTKGNCVGCHPSGRRSGGKPPLFTDFTYDNLGVPRNTAIAANADSSYFDLGLCGPFREDLAARTDLCGAFKVPTLRNVAITAPYFHNGRFQTLREVVDFYVRRDTNPEEWYPFGANGLPHKFDDLPAQYVRNVNTTEVPYNRHPGDAPALSADEIDDVVAFLQTLTDGYTQ